MSGFLSRLTPRWSTRTASGSARPIALEPFSSAIVLVGPPLSASLPSFSFPPNRSVGPKPVQPSAVPIRLCPSDRKGAGAERREQSDGTRLCRVEWQDGVEGYDGVVDADAVGPRGVDPPARADVLTVADFGRLVRLVASDRDVVELHGRVAPGIDHVLGADPAAVKAGAVVGDR